MGIYSFLLSRLSLQTETAIDFSNWIQALSSWSSPKQTGTSSMMTTTTATTSPVTLNDHNKKSTLPTTRKSAVSLLKFKKNDLTVTIQHQIPHPRYSGTHSSNRSFLTKKSSFGGTANMDTVQHHKKMETSLNHVNLPVSYFVHLFNGPTNYFFFFGFCLEYKNESNKLY